MAVPKKRTGHSAQGKRRSNWKATKPELTTCPNCGAKVLTPTVCTACGQYKGKVVSRKAEGFVENAEVKETKPAKKTAAKAQKPAEENVKAEEAKVVEEKVEKAEAEETAKEEAKAEEVKEDKDETPEA